MRCSNRQMCKSVNSQYFQNNTSQSDMKTMVQIFIYRYKFERLCICLWIEWGDFRIGFSTLMEGVFIDCETCFQSYSLSYVRMDHDI